MASRAPEEAVARFVEYLRTTTGCITQVPLVAQPTGTNVFHVIFHGGGPVELRTDRGYPPILLSVVRHCRAVPHPHLHLSPRIPPVELASSRQDPQYVSFIDMHITTGHIGLKDIVRILINDFSVRPLRRDWINVLKRNAHRAI